MKHLYAILFLCLAVSCTPRAVREAERTLHEADSLRAAGELLQDTVRLQHAADAFSRITHKEELARVYYYLGRNLSIAGRDDNAVDYYIAATRLKPKDNNLQGRLYYNMAYICSQQQKDSLAIITVR